MESKQKRILFIIGIISIYAMLCFYTGGIVC
jgi:hypothetical protein